MLLLHSVKSFILLNHHEVNNSTYITNFSQCDPLPPPPFEKIDSSSEGDTSRSPSVENKSPMVNTDNCQPESPSELLDNAASDELVSSKKVTSNFTSNSTFTVYTLFHIFRAHPTAYFIMLS